MGHDKLIIALDLDETLLDSNRELSNRTLGILKKCKKKGYCLAISSTRGYGSCKQMAKRIGADYVCCQAGNMIVDRKGNVVYKNGFSKQQISDFVDFITRYTTKIAIDSDFNLYGSIGDGEQNNYWGILQHDIDDLKNMNVYKFCVQFEPDYKKQIEDYCASNGYICRDMRGADVLLITPANSDKFYALQKLVEMHQTDLNHLIVFGDDHSDLLSIQNAKYGVAVANARPEVLSAAKFVTTSNDNDGVAAFLEKNFQ